MRMCACVCVFCCFCYRWKSCQGLFNLLSLNRSSINWFGTIQFPQLEIARVLHNFGAAKFQCDAHSHRWLMVKTWYLVAIVQFEFNRISAVFVSHFTLFRTPIGKVTECERALRVEQMFAIFFFSIIFQHFKRMKGMIFVLKMSISEFIDWYQWALCGHTMNCLPLPLELCASIHWFWLPLRYNSSGQSKFAHVDVIEWVPELVRLNPQISRCENLLTTCVSMFLCEINAKRIGKCIAEHEQTHTKKEMTNNILIWQFHFATNKR